MLRVTVLLECFFCKQVCALCDAFLVQVKYVESSAKHKVHVDKAFHDLVRVIR